MIHHTADISGLADICPSVSIWHYAQVRESARIGPRTSVGRGAYIDHHVVIGRDCKIQNYALIYSPARIGDGVFIGPAAQLINDLYPRAVDEHGKRLEPGAGWDPQGVIIEDGASIGAGSIVLPGVTIGRLAMIGAGSVVTHDVPPRGIWRGQPAKEHGWVP